MNLTQIRQACAGAAMLAVLAFTLPAAAGPSVGSAAPDFTAKDTNGATVKLSNIKSDLVILEWTNHECPFVKKHYGTGNMQALQAEMGEMGATWITIISSAPGKQGHVSAEEANKIAEDEGASVDHIIIDEAGTIGRLYDASTTPHMFVIGKGRVLRYMGAIDDKPSGQPSSVKGAKNYVRDAVTQIAAGNDVAEPETTPYGCSVKY